MKTKIFTFIHIILLTTFSFGTNILKHIPDDAYLILELNNQSITQKTNQSLLDSSITFHELQKDLMRQILKLYDTPDELRPELFDFTSMGLSSQENSYMFLVYHDNAMSFHFLNPISNRKLLEAKMDSLSQHENWNSIGSEKTKGYMFARNKKLIHFNEEFVLFSQFMPYQYKENEMEIESQMMFYCNNIMSTIDNNISQNKYFLKQRKQNNDVFAFSNSQGIKGIFEQIKQNKEIAFWAKTQEKILSLYNYNMTATLNFNNGNITGAFNTIYNDKDQLKHAKNLTKNKINQDFFKYVSEKPILVGAYSFSPMAIKDAAVDMLYPILNDVPNFGTSITNGLDLLGVFLDEEAIFKLIEGDIVYAINDVVKYQKTYTTYDYNEDYDYVEKEVTEEKTMPSFIAMISTKDEDSWNKIFEILNQSLKKIITKENNVYQIDIPTFKDIPFFLKVEKGIVFLTNDSSTFIPQSKKLDSKILIDGTSKKNIIFYTDLQRIFTLEENSSNELIQYLQNNNVKIRVSGTKFKKNVSSMKLQMNFENNSENAINVMFSMMDEIKEISKLNKSKYETENEYPAEKPNENETIEETDDNYEYIEEGVEYDDEAPDEIVEPSH